MAEAATLFEIVLTLEGAVLGNDIMLAAASSPLPDNGRIRRDLDRCRSEREAAVGPYFYRDRRFRSLVGDSIKIIRFLKIIFDLSTFTFFGFLTFTLCGCGTNIVND